MAQDQDQDDHYEDPIVASLKAMGKPVTRENYIAHNWDETPKDWNAEHEAELPEELQDFDQFHGEGKS
jgi:hypothetical protein